MDDWIQILFNQWYITLLANDITWVCCELNKLRKVYNVISRYWSHVQRIYVYWIRLDRVLKDVIDTTKFSSKVVLIGSFTNILIYTPWLINHAHACKHQDGFLFFTTILFFFTFQTIYLKYLKTLKLEEKLSLASQTMCDRMFSDPESDHNFHVFWLCT